MKERVVGWFGSVTGVTSIMGSWQVCHSVCLALIAVLSAIGITIVGMPLEFLTRIAVPLWSIAAVLLLISIGIYLKRKCISQQLILFNSGLLIAGIPFSGAAPFLPYLWAGGGTMSAVAIVLFVHQKYNEKECSKEKYLFTFRKKGSKDLWTSIVFGIALGAIIIFLLFFLTGNTKKDENKEQQTQEQTTEQNAEQTATGVETIATGSTESGDVLIEITPAIENSKLIALVSFNTHSVDLSKFDLQEITTLEYGGKTIKPSAAPSLSGHHASGEIVFDIDGEDAISEEFQIRILGIPAEEERIYEWNIEE